MVYFTDCTYLRTVTVWLFQQSISAIIHMKYYLSISEKKHPHPWKTDTTVQGNNILSFEDKCIKFFFDSQSCKRWVTSIVWWRKNANRKRKKCRPKLLNDLFFFYAKNALKEKWMTLIPFWAEFNLRTPEFLLLFKFIFNAIQSHITAFV